MTFDIQIDVAGKRYKMQVERIYAGDSIERFKVSGGGKWIVLHCNRPELLASNAKKSIDWKLKEGQVSSGNIEATTFALYRMMMAIEHYIKEKEPNNEEYNKGKV